MKILHVCSHFYPCVGGVEKYVEDLCINLRKEGHQSDVVCLDTCAYGSEKLKPEEEYRGIKVFRIPYTNLKYYKPAFSVLKHLKSYDIIHVHGVGFFSDLLLLTRFIHKKPVIVSGHGGMFHTKKLLPIKKIYFKAWTRLALRLADEVIAESKNNYRHFSEICKPVLIPYSIYAEDFSTAREEEKNSFLFVGRISRNKRVDNLVRMVSFLKKFVPSVKLYVVGGDWENIKKDLDKLVADLKLEKNVIFPGEKRGKALLKYYGKSRFFVSASEYEGFGISVVESMAAGCIPIVNGIESFRNFIENGKNGFIIDFSKPEEAAESIRNIMKRKDLGRIARKAKETAMWYDWSNTMKKILWIYEEVAGKH